MAEEHRSTPQRMISRLVFDWHHQDVGRRPGMKGLDYHIVVDRHFYSVPYRLVHSKIDVFLTATMVSVFLRGERVASHARSFIPAAYTTLAEHMPPAHQAMAHRTPDRL